MIDREDCPNCNDVGVYIETMQHSNLRDESYKCSCGTKWTYIMEGERKHRLQVEYPRDERNI